jgi:hypothetical protein
MPQTWIEVLAGVVVVAVTADAAVAMAYQDLPLGRGVVVVEESRAPGCQPWRWNRDQSDCIRATAERARATGAVGIGFTRGREYRYSGELPIPARLVVSAVGDPSLPRPILRGDRTARGIMLQDGAELRNLDIRGPYYNSAPFRVRLHDDWQFKGINAANQSNWSVVGTSVNGFAGTGLLAVMGRNIRIVGSTFAHNGYSGVSLFPHEGFCGDGVEFRGNVLDRNGQNGIDACPSNARYEQNVFRDNGWGRAGGDSNGLLVFTFAVPSAQNITILGNEVHGNAESGIRVVGPRITGVRIEGNRVSGNGHFGLDVGGDGTGMRNVVVRQNQVDRNGQGCLSPGAGPLAVRPAQAGCGG